MEDVGHVIWGGGGREVLLYKGYAVMPISRSRQISQIYIFIRNWRLDKHGFLCFNIIE